MKREHVRPCVAVLGLAVVAWSIAVRVSTQVTAQQPRPAVAAQATAPATPTPPSPHTWVGVSSCAATSCHGRTAPAGSAAAEYTTWITRDPHARAFEVLFNPRSVRMASLLRESLRGQPAHESPLCLDCHAPGPRQASQRGRNFDRSFGVGCEACHGPAGDWLNPHTTAAWLARGWQAADGEFKAGLGMVSTKDLATRAATCAQCHVGEPGREVNHDLIAAGHPRLAFEFSSHHWRLPKHWRERRTAADSRPRDRDIHSDWDLRAWAIGQLVSARTACELITHRAAAAESDAAALRTWPEFAEFDCFACHQPIQSPLAPSFATPQLRPGSLIPGDWYFTRLPDALRLAGGDALSADAVKQLAAISLQPEVARDSVPAAARDAAAKLAGLARHSTSRPLTESDPRRLVRDWTASPGTSPARWDHAAQLTLALQAAFRAARNLHPSPTDVRIEEALRDLAAEVWPRSANTPREKSTLNLIRFDPAAFGSKLKRLQQVVE